MTQDNPLLRDQLLPPFDQIEWAHVEPALDQVIADHTAGIEALLEQGDWTWDELVIAEEKLSDRISRVWNPVAQMQASVNTPELQDVHTRGQQRLSEHYTRLAQDSRRREAYQQLAKDQGLQPSQLKLVSDRLLDFRLGGADLSEAAQNAFLGMQSQLSALSSRFMANVLAATESWSLPVDLADAEGLPETILDILAQRATSRGQSGYLVTLDQPSYIGVMSYADNAELRKVVFEAYASRAAEWAGEQDNSPVIKQILETRTQASQLLGFADHAAYSFASKMAPEPQAAMDFLNQLLAKVKPRAEAEFQELTQWAQESAGIDSLAPWDLRYYAEKMRQDQYDLDEEALRPYFALPRVVEGMMEIARRLFDVRFELISDAAVWHPDVQLYQVLGPMGEVEAYFYLDATARPGKREGAWMEVCRTLRRNADGVQPPVAFLNTNFAAATEDRPSLLTHREVITLFHEFGHGLHHMLSRIEVPSQSGINGVEWDAVELPSQFMENWCWQPEALALFAKHHETGAALPDEDIQRLMRARHFQSAMNLLRQLEFGLFDLKLHMSDGSQSALEIWREVRRDVSVTPTGEFERFPNYFAHIFSGGYDAGYYSYLWAQQLASDAFDAFESRGIFDPELGARFRSEILERGSSRTAMDSYLAFRGRQPLLEPLLKYYGIAA